MMRAPLCLLTYPAFWVLCASLLLAACEEEAPTPVPLDNRGMMQPDAIDFVALTGQNVADPNTSPSCPLGITCAVLPGEPTSALVAGTCNESHFRVMADGARTFVDEITRVHLTQGRLSRLSSDRGEYTLTYSSGRIKSVTFKPAQPDALDTTTTFDYGFSGLVAITTALGTVITQERAFAYDARGRTATSFDKIRNADGTFTRQSSVYSYNGERSREIWRDLDVDNTLSEPDELESTSQWREDGLLEAHVIFVEGEPTTTLSYTYDEGGMLTGTALEGMGETLERHTFSYDELGRLEAIEWETRGIRLELVRDEGAALTRAQLLEGDARLLYEIQMSGTSCDRPLNTWIRLLDTMSAPLPE